MSLRLIKLVYKLAERLPANERYGMVAQVKRAALSVALNIAEESGRKTSKDFACFINRSIASTQEIDAACKIAINLDYFSKNDKLYIEVEPVIEKIYYKLIAFYKKLLD